MSAAPDTTFIRCPTCGATNKIDSQRLDEGIEPVCGKCKARLSQPSKPMVVTDATFARDVEQSPVPVLLDLWATWCPPCRMLAPTVEALAAQMTGKIRVAKLDVDESPQTAARFGVQSIPTLLILKGGREVDRMVGVQSGAAILSRINRAL
ncbi:MAG TPA: thioredoxin [Blastocatellia bacterium]|nr:thioredoxin [Blastocatellia bacterium]